MSGILTQFAAATATKGTRRPTIPAFFISNLTTNYVESIILKFRVPERVGLLEIILLQPSAVTTLADVAATYAVNSCSLVTPTDALRFE